MAAQFTITTGKTALVAATAKTVIEGSSTANVPPEWIGFDITFDGVTATNTPVLIEFMTFSTTGTGTTYTPKKSGQSVGTAASTWKINDTVEPGTPVVIFGWQWSPTSGIAYQWPLGRELFHPISTIQAVRVTAAQVVNYLANLYIEE